MNMPTRKRFWLGGSVLSMLLVTTPLYAATQSAESLLKHMKMALEPAKASTRTMTFTVHSASFNESTKIVAQQARRAFPGEARSVTMVVSPESLKGVTVLVQERKGSSNLVSVYYPTLKRVRSFSGIGAFEPFLGTDFTYADLGLLDVSERTLKLLGTNEHDGAKAYEVQETPKNTSYYARIVDRIDATTGLPLERDHYDVANVLWRKQIYDNVATIDGVLTPMKVRIEDVQSGDWSELVVNDLHYDVQVPEAVFDAQKLSEVSSNPLWVGK
jgi:hypothetical protein